MFSDAVASAGLRADDPLDIATVRLGRYRLLGLLGSGTYGEVYEADSDGKTYALKIARSEEVSWPELEAYQRLLPDCASYVVCTFEWFEFPYAKKSWVCIVQQRMDGSLVNVYRAFPDVADFGYLLIDLLLGLACLHSKQLAHMDVRPANILYVETKERVYYKLADLGNACTAQEVQGKISYLPACTKNSTYFPPDVLQAKDFTLHTPLSLRLAQSIDVWCAGLVVYMMLSERGYYSSKAGRDLAMGATWNNRHLRMNLKRVPTDAWQRKVESFGPISAEQMAHALDLMLNSSSDKRPTAEQIADSLGLTPALKESRPCAAPFSG